MMITIHIHIHGHLCMTFQLMSKKSFPIPPAYLPNIQVHCETPLTHTKKHKKKKLSTSCSCLTPPIHRLRFFVPPRNKKKHVTPPTARRRRRHLFSSSPSAWRCSNFRNRLSAATSVPSTRRLDLRWFKKTWVVRDPYFIQMRHGEKKDPGDPFHDIYWFLGILIDNGLL